jgi:hypothetical protein
LTYEEFQGGLRDSASRRVGVPLSNGLRHEAGW